MLRPGGHIMATRTKKPLVIPTPRVLEDAVALAARFKHVDSLRRHALQRKPLLQGASAVLVLLGLACGAGVFVFFGGSGGWLALPAMMLAPVVALGALFVLFYIFFSWVEARALAQALGHRTGRASALERWLRRKARIDLLARPAVPWIPAVLLVALPFALLVAAAPAAGIALILVAIAGPLAYARLDGG
jgi:hypothetical protein